jgi:hypothetical protein
VSNRAVTAVGVALLLVGVVVTGLGLVYLAGALSPENDSDLREIAVVAGAAVSIVGALPVIAGVVLLVVARRRGRAEAVAAFRS